MNDSNGYVSKPDSCPFFFNHGDSHETYSFGGDFRFATCCAICSSRNSLMILWCCLKGIKCGKLLPFVSRTHVAIHDYKSSISAKGPIARGLGKPSNWFQQQAFLLEGDWTISVLFKFNRGKRERERERCFSVYGIWVARCCLRVPFLGVSKGHQRESPNTFIFRRGSLKKQQIQFVFCFSFLGGPVGPKFHFRLALFPLQSLRLALRKKVERQGPARGHRGWSKTRGPRTFKLWFLNRSVGSSILGGELEVIFFNEVIWKLYIYI